MGCDNEQLLKHVAYDCADKPKGGLTEVYAVRLADVTATDLGDGELDITAVTLASVAKIDFNNKDGFSYAGTVFSAEPDGTETYTPTVAIQVPRVTLDKLEAIKPMMGSFNEILVIAVARTGIETAYGADAGCYINAVNSTTGTNAEKNMLDMTFTGDEDSMERVLSATSLDLIKAALVV